MNRDPWQTPSDARSDRTTGELAMLFADIGVGQLALLAAVAFVAATVSGMSGVGGGLVLVIFIAPVVGVKAVVPTVGIAGLIAHVIRVRVYRGAPSRGGRRW